MELPRAILRVGRKTRHFVFQITIGKILIAILLLTMAVFSLMPFVYTVVQAFKPPSEFFIYPPRFYVVHPTLDNFFALFIVGDNAVVPTTKYLFNTVIITIVGVFLTILFTSMCAYAVSKMRLRFQAFYFQMIIVLLMFSPYILSIPRYMVVTTLGIYNTMWALFLPGIANAFYLFMIKQFIDAFPDALIEAAKIDGAGELGIFFKLVFPNLKPAIATLTLLSFVYFWTDGTNSTIYITNQSLKTFQVGLSTLATGTVGRQGAIAAALLLAMIPTLIVFGFTQKMVVETMTYSGLKT